ncbi:MAG: hypothetical protein KKI06_03560 [Euryarchaeota archaeon]|nr:hypothetical protein [Euryarchaeota archaeon]
MRIKLYPVVFLVLVISLLSAGCVQIPGTSPTSATPSASVSPTISETSQAVTPVETSRTPLSYKVFIDEYYGFRKVIETSYKKEVEYQNLTLTIYAGDVVEWVNDNDYKMTLVSDQGLWTPGDIRAILMNRGFNYTFTNPGTYTFRIKEETKIKPQTIIVKP